MLPIVRKVFFALVSLLLCIELILRFGYGFCNAPLYITDPDYEYIYAPNQKIRRFGNQITTNSLSMRSDALSSSDSIVVLLTGDSVVNGGSLTSNSKLASTLLEHKLSAALGKKVRVLNISAGSWGPDNVAAYLRKHGTFGAQVLGLVTSSHDAYDLMTHHDQVGIDPNLPDKQYKIALSELWNRYLYPYYFRDIKFNQVYYAPTELPADSLSENDRNGIWKSGDHFNPGYAELNQLAKDNGIPFFVYLHPETFEITDGEYNEQGQEIIEFARRDSIRLIEELKIPPLLDFYRKNDVVHYNEEGQQFMAEQLFPLYLDYLKRLF